MSVDPKLVEILACPQCKGELKHREGPREGFACETCKLLYVVQDSIPNFLIDEALPLSDVEPG